MSHKILAACVPLRMPPPAKAVLLALADQCNDDGVCWPGLQSLVEWTCLAERTVRSAIRWLEAHQAVVVEQRRRQNGSLASNAYRLQPSLYVPDAAPPVGLRAGVGQEMPQGGGAGDAPGVGQVLPGGGAGAAPGVGQEPPPFEPPYRTNTNTPPTPKGGRNDVAATEGLIDMATFLALCRERGEKPVPAEDPVWTQAEAMGLSDELLRMAWREFKRRRGEAKKRARGIDGWRQQFRCSVRDNWYRLWFTRPGEEPQLSTQGVQAKALQAAEDRARAARAGADQSAAPAGAENQRAGAVNG